MQEKYLVGTRGSALALTQATLAVQQLEAAGERADVSEGESEHTPRFELVTVKTEGDRLTGSLATLGGTGVFAAALRQQLIDGAVDAAIHSLKDLPSAPHPDLVVAATLAREDARDALIARDNLTLDTLPFGARVGTGSPRRAAQLRALRNDLEVVDIRGNVGTRLGRVKGLEEHSKRQVVVRASAETAQAAHTGVGAEIAGDCDAVVLAAAGLKRLSKEHLITEYLDTSRMLPAPGQGALAVEVRRDEYTNPEAALMDEATRAEPVRPLGRLLAAADDLPTRLAVSAERALLRRLEAGCAAPIGAHAQLVEGDLVLSALVAAPNGSRCIRHSAATAELDVPGAERLGVEVAQDLLQMGAAALAGLDVR